ncbi:class I adenylate-forming enzyme family protein [Bacillus dakarensis]|uniref:class I adenylate-forming enzyme family protein n=1 Tax=Robertmurraya dakarensis TaxID=1926278 RepID=UPI000981C06A|nr:class I adenylate-forming enzyme family protein [Bacillus dakarensis]
MIDHISQWVKLAQQNFAERTAVIGEDEIEISYRDLINQSTELAKAMRDDGISDGDHIAVWMPNSLEWILLEIACGMLGAVLVGLNPRYRIHELEYMIGHTDCKWLFYDHGIVEAEQILKEMLPELFIDEAPANFKNFPLLKKVISIGGNGPKGAESWEKFNGAPFINQKEPLHILSNQLDPLNILFTSGTTSRPKGAILNQGTIIGHSFNTGSKMEISKDDVCLAALPFCGIFGLNSLWQALVKGATVVVIDQFEIEKVCDRIEKYSCTVWNAADQMYMKLIDYSNENKVNLSSLRIGAAGMFIYDGLDIIQKVEKNLNYRILHTYGMSEVGSMLFLRKPSDRPETRSISGGQPTSGKVKIIDPNTLEELPFKKVGEIVVSGMNVTTGYYNRPEANESSFMEGNFFRTGDLGRKLEDGTIEYLGRLKEALRLSGFLVSPSEIEGFLEEIIGVELAQVVGVQLDHHIIVTAFVKLEEGKTLSIEDIQQECKKLAHFKRPKKIFIVEDFPKSFGSNGEKIRRDLLAQMAIERIKSSS